MGIGTILLITLLSLMGLFIISVYMSFRKSKLRFEDDE